MKEDPSSSTSLLRTLRTSAWFDADSDTASFSGFVIDGLSSSREGRTPSSTARDERLGMTMGRMRRGEGGEGTPEVGEGILPEDREGEESEGFHGGGSGTTGSSSPPSRMTRRTRESASSESVSRESQGEEGTLLWIAPEGIGQK
ncbi:hypothetical protein FA13DRAFT_596004 [Coprinellus micaceus]|uniref:Uncharacterized protein n=1 Tax=Coprinellus micaceus TaxID=71717 RepID=A0A4Y7T775_COPMI|nr:hypothetical protein FA13DRAFT_596004 [Coprinellus micaceus]